MSFSPPEPADKEFVAKVRSEMSDARAACLKLLGKEKPRPVKRKRPTAVSEVVLARRERVLTLLMSGHKQREIAAEVGVQRGLVQDDVREMCLTYAARNVHHLTALATLELVQEALAPGEQWRRPVLRLLALPA